MVRENLSFQSVQGLPLSGRKWIPEETPRGIVQLVHGMAEHIDRYDQVASFLCGRGFLVVGHNHLGHGKDAALHGYFGDRDGWRALVEDVHTLRNTVQAEYPRLPYFLLGHSMGSFVVRCYLMKHSEGLAGAVLSGTGYFPGGVVSAGLALSGLICLAGGKKKESPLINRIGFSGSNKPFAPNRTDFDWLSRDEKEVDKYVADPLCGFLFTAGGYRDLFRGLKQMSDPEKLKGMRSDLPVLFISGGQDPVGSMGAGVEKTAEAFRAAGLSDVQVCLYPGARHELFNELNREEVFAGLAGWLERHLA